jgi:predicted esterase
VTPSAAGLTSVLLLPLPPQPKSETTARPQIHVVKKEDVIVALYQGEAIEKILQREMAIANKRLSLQGCRSRQPKTAWIATR